MSDANQTLVTTGVESSYGVAAASPYDVVRITGENLKANKGAITSQELRSDRQVTDVIQTVDSASGALNFEWSYGAQDIWMRSVLQSADWANTAAMAAGDNMTIAANNVVTRNAGSFITEGFVVGMWVTMANWDESTSNGTFVVQAIPTALTMILGGAALAVEASAETDVTIVGCDEVVNGVAPLSHTIEKKFVDLTHATHNVWHLGLGMQPDTFSLNAATGAVITGSVGFVGKSMATADATVGGSPTAAPTWDVLSGVANAGQLVVGATGAYAKTLGMTSWTLQIQNNLRERMQIGTLGAISIGSGTISVTGTVTFYHTNDSATDNDSSAILDMYLGFTDAFMGWKITDNDGNIYGISMPRVKFTDGDVVAGGINTDVVVNLTYQAIMTTTTEAKTIRIARLTA